jgi:hypothetical protein
VRKVRFKDKRATKGNFCLISRREPKGGEVEKEKREGNEK